MSQRPNQWLKLIEQSNFVIKAMVEKEIHLRGTSPYQILVYIRKLLFHGHNTYAKKFQFDI